MKLVIGLGNPESRYNFTRHNTGFLVLDYLFKVEDLKWSEKPRFGALWGRSGDVLFIKPQEFYNESGKAVTAYMNYYKIDVSDILVVCDDFNLEFGKIRYRASGQAGGNNGLKSIVSSIGTEAFPRLRVGTGNDELRAKLGDTDFVLSKYTPEEKAQLGKILTEVIERIGEIIKTN